MNKKRTNRDPLLTREVLSAIHSQRPLTAIEAAHQLDPAELQQILDSKSPPSPEQERKSAVQAVLAEADKLPGDKLAQFVQTHRVALLALETLNIKRNVTSIDLSGPELDGLLLVLDNLAPDVKKDLATRIQQAAVAAGLPQGQPLHVFAQKLTRMGLHL